MFGFVAETCILFAEMCILFAEMCILSPVFKFVVHAEVIDFLKLTAEQQ